MLLTPLTNYSTSPRDRHRGLQVAPMEADTSSTTLGCQRNRDRVRDHDLEHDATAGAVVDDVVEERVIKQQHLVLHPRPLLIRDTQEGARPTRRGIPGHDQAQVHLHVAIRHAVMRCNACASVEDTVLRTDDRKTVHAQRGQSADQSTRDGCGPAATVFVAGVKTTTDRPQLMR